MIKASLSVVRVAAFCLSLALVTSCGSSDQGAPPGSAITVTPNAVPWTVSAAPCDNLTLEDTYFLIAAKNPNGTVLTGIDIRVSLDLAPGTFITPPLAPAGITAVMFLYNDTVGDGTGAFTVPITSFPFLTTTGSSGTKMLRVQYDLSGCTYSGNLNVYSGSSFGTANIKVTTVVAPP